MADKIREWLTQMHPCEKAESPIEHLLFAAFRFMEPTLMLPKLADFRLEQQIEIGKYRVDFRFHVLDEERRPKYLVVEVDGHEFHERTKAQAARDRSRDRSMDADGIAVMRFTGSEVWANPFSCVEEIARKIYFLRHGRSEREATARAGLEAIKAMLTD